MLKLYENIKQNRCLRGWSQDELARRVGYSDKSMISKIEKGVVDLSHSQISRFASAFGLSASDLLGDDGVISPAAAPPSPEQADLLEKYDSLSDTGRELLLSRADELIRLGYTIEEEAKKEGGASA